MATLVSALLVGLGSWTLYFGWERIGREAWNGRGAPGMVRLAAFMSFSLVIFLIALNTVLFLFRSPTAWLTAPATVLFSVALHRAAVALLMRERATTNFVNRAGVASLAFVGFLTGLLSLPGHRAAAALTGILIVLVAFNAYVLRLSYQTFSRRYRSAAKESTQVIARRTLAIAARQSLAAR